MLATNGTRPEKIRPRVNLPGSDTLIMTSYGSSWQALANVTCPPQAAWAKAQGFDYYAWKCDLADNYWNPHTNTMMRLPIKGFVKMTLFCDFLAKYKTVCWLDNDLLVTNQAVKLEDLMTDAPITVPYDWNSHNATVIIARSSPLVRDYFWACENTGRKLFLNHDWVEMEAMRYFAQTPPYNHILGYQSAKLLCPLHPGAYRPYVPDAITQPYDWEPGAFSIHLSALPQDRRVELAMEYAAK